jgi:Fur family ferric uptake transcriptional regulator
VSAAGGVASIRSRGRRLTAQRAAIWDVLVERGDEHVSAGELAAAVRARARELHRSTVYRTLDVLVEDGLVLRTHLGGDRSYYELAAEHRHHHVVCAGCGAVAHVHDDAIAAALACVQAASGYRLARQELTFGGLCPACAAKSLLTCCVGVAPSEPPGSDTSRNAARAQPSPAAPPPGPGPRPAALGIDATSRA